MRSSTIVPKEAIITMKQGRRTLSGMRLFEKEIAAFERVRTNKVAKPIPRPLIAEEVTPSVGHIPKSITSIGFSLIMPLVKLSKLLFMLFSLLYFSFRT